MLTHRCDSCNAPFQQSALSVHRPAHARLEERAAGGESFLVLPGGATAGAASLRGDAHLQAHAHDHVQLASALTELGRTTPEQGCQVPLCADCATFVLRDLEGRARDVSEQNATFVAALQDERRRAAAETQLPSDLARENARAAKEEGAVERELADLLAQQLQVRAALATLAAERAELDAQADELWQRANCAQLAAIERADGELHNAQLLAHCNRELRRLKATSVLDDVFDIWFEGAFGTVNGLRLGRLPAEQVEWAEINAALGHAALLVDTLAAAHHLRLPKHTLHIMGSFTKIAHNDEPKALLELHGSGSLQLGRIFSGTRFDRALCMFLQCVGALVAHARRSASDSLGEAPYRIEEDRIGTPGKMLSIRLQFNQDELWTRALKYMLTDLKWLLAWSSQVTAVPKGESASVAASPHR
ncbi:autophagy protein Apg6-domain-containing protein [Pavlovales sp. CCMP2436]|nr:autophagy protein Apg6-domain-containing protein [Pavlovales sp. CCMP2436]|mmetsp:Transcript_938/g.2455  ORF Transcript_938/g.2455 Transcript_938/m.2455 type:complete len:419 (-) Transcript_938:168-1424(-)